MDNYDSAQARLRRCAPRSRCGLYRACDRCAAIRQARIADLAERLHAALGPLSWTTIQPTYPGAQALDLARRAWLRGAAPAGAIWTIEQSQITGNLHANIIHDQNRAYQSRQYHSHTIETVDNVRHVAAYISKRRQMPEEASYPSRLTGRAGPLWHHLLNATTAPILQMAAIQHTINSHERRESQAARQDRAADTDRKTALARLPALRAILE